MAGWDRVLRMAAIAALGFTLSACGGAAGNSSAAASAAQSSTSSGSPVATDSSAPAQDGAQPQSSTAGQNTSTGTPTPSPTDSGGSSPGGSNPPTASVGVVTINWNPPTQNTDGSALTNLAGFKIHYGTASQRYTQTITVSNPGLATYVVSNLPPGTYYFAVTAYSSAGTESPPSAEVHATVD